MGYDGWIEYDGVELVNLSRTAQLAETLGIDSVWTEPSEVRWIQDGLGDGGFPVVNYATVTTAPWYDSGVPASAEFAGIVPLAITGLGDSTREATTVEYLTDGGSSGRPRNKTKPLVANVILVASTERGADYGKRWMDRILSAKSRGGSCSGVEMAYFQYKQATGLPVPPRAHLRDVALTRGSTVTRRRSTHCSVTWTVTFTLTAHDPFEYGEPVEQFAQLGGAVLGPLVTTSGSILNGVEADCPVYDYTPIYDPLSPALLVPPTAPDFYPDNWRLVPGAAYDRYWVRLDPSEPTVIDFVPVLTLTTDFDARFVRVSVWPGDAATDSTCEPLWSAIVSYLPVGMEFVIDGEQKASYAWDGVSANVRRTDSLVYSRGARPVQWGSFNDSAGLLVTLDVTYDGTTNPTGGGTVRASLALVSKSD